MYEIPVLLLFRLINSYECILTTGAYWVRKGYQYRRKLKAYFKEEWRLSIEIMWDHNTTILMRIFNSAKQIKETKIKLDSSSDFCFRDRRDNVIKIIEIK